MWNEIPTKICHYNCKTCNYYEHHINKLEAKDNQQNVTVKLLKMFVLAFREILYTVKITLLYS